MKNISFVLMCILAGCLTACDVKDDLNKPKTALRTVIIGGVPVAEHDYQITAREQTRHSAVQQP
ncbi:NF038215 family lipoprotein [Acinetobacter sp. GXMZU3951]|jgi:hypothetical protein